MASTTLYTFLLETTESIGSVELLGSWDNFSRPYPMQKDRKIGSGHWRGCHSFKDIVCDGDAVFEGKRNGCLRMGGTYWYYYRLDDELEFHNPVEPSTTACPFLPGQQVNVLEVPILVQPLAALQSSESTSCLSSILFTLNPEDRFLAPRPPSPSLMLACLLKDPLSTPNGQGDQVSTRPETAGGLSISNILHNTPSHSPRSTSCPRSRDADWRSESASSNATLPRSIGHLRRSLSAGCRPSTNHSRQGNDLLDSVGTTSHGPVASRNPSVPFDPLLSSDSGSQTTETRPLGLHIESIRESAVDHLETLKEPTGELRCSSPGYSLLHESFTDSLSHPNSPTKESSIPEDLEATKLNIGSGKLFVDKFSWLSLDNEYDDQDFATENRLSVQMDDVPYYSSNSEVNGRRETYTLAESGLDPAKSISSNRTSAIFSATSGTTSHTGYITPSYCSQPITPTMSEFGGLVLNTHHSDMSVLDEADEFSRYDSDGGFEGYNLPDNEHASALTLKNLTSVASKSQLRGPSALEDKKGKRYVERWMNGGGNGKTAVQKLVDDLGYLGTMIA